MTKALTAAQQLRLSFFGEVKRYSYKPPHALQPTPAKPHRPRKHWDAMKFSAYLRPYVSSAPSGGVLSARFHETLVRVSPARASVEAPPQHQLAHTWRLAPWCEL